VSSPADDGEDTAEQLAAKAPRLPKELITAWVLLLLSDGAAHGYQLRRELDAQQVSVDASRLYRNLRCLERDGCVKSRWETAVAGPRRRCYRLTPAGRRMLDDTAARLSVIAELHTTFVGAYRRSLRPPAGDDRAGARAST